MGRPLGIDFNLIFEHLGKHAGKENRAKREPEQIMRGDEGTRHGKGRQGQEGKA